MGYLTYCMLAKHLKKKTIRDLLVVTITPDKFVTKGPGRPVFNENLY